MDADTDQKVLRVLSEAINTDAAALPRDYPLEDRGLLDSMAAVQLIAGLSEAFNIDISPAEFEREAWATPQLIIDDIHRRLAQDLTRP